MLAMPGHRIGSRLPIEFFEHLKQSHDLERRAAKRVRLRACKSRWRAGSIDNFGFQIIDPHHNWIVAEERFDCTADDVVGFCAEYEGR